MEAAPKHNFFSEEAEALFENKWGVKAFRVA
jgi:hypothetical protein